MKNHYSPIPPLGSSAKWKGLRIRECGEPLVPLGAFSAYAQIATDAIYASEHASSPYAPGELEGALTTMFVRASVAEGLADAAARLPHGHKLLVWDAYRPQSVQKILFDRSVAKLERSGSSHAQARKDAERFFSAPSDDPLHPSPHATGAAIDLTIIRFDSKDDMRRMSELDIILKQPQWQNDPNVEYERQKIIRLRTKPIPMGTRFDEVTSATATRYYEGRVRLTGDEREIRDNRRMLWTVMTEAGFSNYPEEWWHFDIGNQFDMARTGRQAIYGAARLSPENESHETLRRTDSRDRDMIHPQAAAV